jgi:hypothetical protein
MFFNETFGNTKPEETTRDVALFLQFSDEHTVPKEIRQTNVLSWYALYTERIYVDTLYHPGGAFLYCSKNQRAIGKC